MLENNNTRSINQLVNCTLTFVLGNVITSIQIGNRIRDVIVVLFINDLWAIKIKYSLTKHSSWFNMSPVITTPNFLKNHTLTDVQNDRRIIHHHAKVSQSHVRINAWVPFYPYGVRFTGAKVPWVQCACTRLDNDQFSYTLTMWYSSVLLEIDARDCGW